MFQAQASFRAPTLPARIWSSTSLTSLNAYRPEALAIDVDYLSALEPFDSKTTQAVCILDRFRDMGWRPLLRSLAQYLEGFRGAIPFLAALFVFYTFLERVLPNNY